MRPKVGSIKNRSKIMIDGYTFEIEKLLEFGFVKKGRQYCYSRQILQNMFEIKISVEMNGQTSWEVWDLDTHEIYSLVKIPTVSGAFVGKVRMACDEVFNEIIERCGRIEIFKSQYTKLVQKYVLEKYGNEFEHLWEKFTDNAVFRRCDNKKWYGAVLTVSKNKLGLDGEDKIEVLDLRGTPEDIQRIVDGKKYFAGYHMNKKHWFTICLDGSVAIEEIYHRIDDSYMLAKK